MIIFSYKSQSHMEDDDECISVCIRVCLCYKKERYVLFNNKNQQSELNFMTPVHHYLCWI
ncbi:uncharacterized protein Smp_201630 [Schistosoma mansoni]|uniref:uncharacterized protein n=1 Tax=Schistosoma mansoni TaxID=6183 RepID=UPI00022DC400|nr:uncharacterized protein Smp_201630 [Schistosoma mansoni]|eukprot:XP_018650591.1 uncharacterized protein Smp_201630 [Schistosoma mansoni]